MHLLSKCLGGKLKNKLLMDWRHAMTFHKLKGLLMVLYVLDYVQVRVYGIYLYYVQMRVYPIIIIKRGTALIIMQAVVDFHGLLGGLGRFMMPRCLQALHVLQGHGWQSFSWLEAEYLWTSIYWCTPWHRQCDFLYWTAMHRRWTGNFIFYLLVHWYLWWS